MANVCIYPEHREILVGLIVSNKVASPLGSVATGPFREQRDAYVFAAAIGIALGKPIAEADMPKSKKGAIDIRDSVFFGSEGARELSVTAVLLQDLDGDEASELGLRDQLEQIASAELGPRLALLDRYAYAGFSWLQENMKDVATIRDLVMEAIDKVVGVDLGVEHLLMSKDPLMELLMQ